jgi:glutathione S-transferase
MIVPRVRHYLITHASFDNAAWRAWVINWVRRGLTAMETRLAGDAATGGFCHGDQVTIADTCLASLVVVAKGLRLKFELSDIPTVTRICARCEEIDAFERRIQCAKSARKFSIRDYGANTCAHDLSPARFAG